MEQSNRTMDYLYCDDSYYQISCDNSFMVLIKPNGNIYDLLPKWLQLKLSKTQNLDYFPEFCCRTYRYNIDRLYNPLKIITENNGIIEHKIL